MTRFLAALVTVTVLLFAFPAAAQVTEAPTVIYPVAKTRVQLDGPHNTWGTRRVARFLNRRLDDLHIYRRGRCEDRPKISCIVIRKVNRPNVDWWGRAYYVSDTKRRIVLNRAYGVDQYAACHELLHALGIAHHLEPGCVTDQSVRTIRDWPSRAEVRALRKAYDD